MYNTPTPNPLLKTKKKKWKLGLDVSNAGNAAAEKKLQ